MKELVLIHGRSQQDKDSKALKRAWIEAWGRGLAAAGLTQPIPEERIRFPYYGDTLRDLLAGISEADAAKIIVRGAQADDIAAGLLLALLNEYIAACGIGEDEIRRNLPPATGPVAVERGPQNWRWVHAVLRAIDQRVPGSGVLIGLLTSDVSLYLRNTNVRGAINGGVGEAFDRPRDKVVVAHSLGSIVAYLLLRQAGSEAGWRVPALITLGSPLGIKAIRGRLGGVRHPDCVGHWFNARDPRDVVALYSLDERNFGIVPAIENKIDVDNSTSNRHGIEGYLEDAEVARRIHDALVA
ncbi:Uncharacterised protein [Achromobacter denitrificans]|uniref:hypothetical protein n=1 Tax=Achromobacter denitrificans TaxID=32002 RepID=UPI000788484C|nr:hypothetical protein [Achromobacter denitrificans]OLU02068.1 hypothetical protein BVK87_26825 [Achromobacter denitrificans]QKH41578.1 alpha/beta hydrolase [Achromobacter denitrificans]QKH51279.1 alpha/beta hydrolase [Achromobacter denitrificans]CAB3741700.1 hypothetical protein LMG1231_05671 [Achromobacter denitrificans]SUU25883.1 Uncharacterised protein [Achromobacter denitrificans]